MKKVIAFVMASFMTACADQCSSDLVDSTDSTEESVACADTSTQDSTAGAVGQAVQDEVESDN